MIVFHIDVMLARRKMSLTELSERVGITIANLSILKTGKARAVRLDTLNRLCAALDCQPADLMEFLPDPPEELPHRQLQFLPHRAIIKGIPPDSPA